MPRIRSQLGTLVMLAALTISISPSALSAQQSKLGKLGKVNFPTSGSEKAQTHFLRGLAALHSFWFEEALDEFRESTKIEPDFAVGYWGEGMAYNNRLWAEKERECARKKIEKIKETWKITVRERV